MSDPHWPSSSISSNRASTPVLYSIIKYFNILYFELILNLHMRIATYCPIIYRSFNF